MSNPSGRTQTTEIEANGYQWIPAVLSKPQCDDVIRSFEKWSSSEQTKGTIDSRDGAVVGARNLLDGWECVETLISQATIRQFVVTHCGPQAGLVRALFFDKPPGAGWALATHRDQTIALREHRDPLFPFSKPTRKAGVAHAQGTNQLLSQMLTLRFHLDDMHTHNGPMTVIPGSHRDGNHASEDVRELHCRAGDVLAMKPLLLHGSLATASESMDHRRVIHFEFAPNNTPAANHDWRWFIQVGSKPLHTRSL